VPNQSNGGPDRFKPSSGPSTRLLSPSTAGDSGCFSQNPRIGMINAMLSLKIKDLADYFFFNPPR
jgi:hypothetical protein